VEKARSRHKSTPISLLAGNRAYVAGPLVEAVLELRTAPALASRWFWRAAAVGIDAKASHPLLQDWKPLLQTV
jgi:hypothetical protein